MKSVNYAIADYLALRRSLGFKLREYGECLREFAAFLKKNGSAHITNKLAVEYATRRQDEKPVSWARRLIIIRGFARYRMGADPRTEIPPIGLLRFRSRRARPYVYSQDEIRLLLDAALEIESPHRLQPHTYHCLFGLLAVSGLRLGEAVNLAPQDVDWSEGVLTIRGAKFGKTRLVPLHPSALAVLHDYAKLRDKIFAGRTLPAFLVTSHGTKLEKTNLSRIFRELSRQVGIRKPGVRNGPRLHDFRHRFAIQTLLRWYRRGESVAQRMPVLSTYLGHGNVSGTYWYLSSTPELIVAASKLIETRWKGAVR
ncbi:MAG: tyrosine-type recombinase/integrase [Limisphaerales bacterium]